VRRTQMRTNRMLVLGPVAGLSIDADPGESVSGC